MPPRVDRPIFIVGCPRSGTSLLYRRLAMHPDVAYFLKWSRKFPTSVALSRLAALWVRDPRPKEAGSVWRRFAGRRDDDRLGKGDVTSDSRRFFQQVVATQTTLFDKPRFLSKHPRNGLRMEYFLEMFPDSIFVHIIRDGRAVANSILDNRLARGGADEYWDVRPPGWPALLGEEPIVACGKQWEMTVRYVRASGAALPAGQYVELAYEDLIRRPQAVLEEVAGHCALDWPRAALESAAADIADRNERWRTALSAEQIEKLQDAIGDYLRELGYARVPA